MDINLQAETDTRTMMALALKKTVFKNKLDWFDNINLDFIAESLNAFSNYNKDNLSSNMEYLNFILKDKLHLNINKPQSYFDLKEMLRDAFLINDLVFFQDKFYNDKIILLESISDVVQGNDKFTMDSKASLNDLSTAIIKYKTKDNVKDLNSAKKYLIEYLHDAFNIDCSSDSLKAKIDYFDELEEKSGIKELNYIELSRMINIDESLLKQIVNKVSKINFGVKYNGALTIKHSVTASYASAVNSDLINISKFTLEQCTFQELLDTIRHELCHIFLSDNHGHDKAFHQMFNSVKPDIKIKHSKVWYYKYECYICSNIFYFMRPNIIKKYGTSRYMCSCGGRLELIERRK